MIKQAFNKKGDFFFISLAVFASVLYMSCRNYRRRRRCTEVNYYEKTQLLKPIHPCTGLSYEFLPSKNIASAWNQRHPCRFSKDSVFVDLFSSDRTAKNNFLALYNALYNTNYQSTAILQNIRLKQTMYMSFANDVSYLVDNKIIVLAEHQSTVNPNMPLKNALKTIY